MTDEYKDFDHPFENMSLDDSCCFLCGVKMDGNSTKEDLFPMWLLRKHNLFKEKLTLINRTLIPYSQLKIPCCAKCNNEHLSQLEYKISSAINSGYHSCLNLDPILIFYWAAKIFYGILRKELSLLVDRRDPQKGSIVPETLIQAYNNLHTFMQGIRRPMEFVGPLPFSVLVANLHDLGNKNNYNFRDNLFCQTLSIRSEGVGIIVALADAGINNQSYARYLKAVDGHKLHPIQFDELYAKVTYESHRLLKAPFFTVAANKDKSLPIQVITHLPSGKIMKDWDQEEFAHLLESVLAEWGVPEEGLFVPPNFVHTYMSNENGSLKFIDPNGNLIE